MGYDALRMIFREEVIFPSYVSEGARHLIGLLLKKNPVERISMQEVAAHPWIIDNADRTDEYKKHWVHG